MAEQLKLSLPLNPIKAIKIKPITQTQVWLGDVAKVKININTDPRTSCRQAPHLFSTNPTITVVL